MKEDQLNSLRQQDTNLRDAIRLEEMERPQMPADLNARLMQRMKGSQSHHEGEGSKKKRIVWPWIAAACVAAFIAVLSAPPQGSTENTEMRAKVTVSKSTKSTESTEVTKSTEPAVAAPAPTPAPVAAAPKAVHKASKCQATPAPATPQTAPEPDVVKQPVATAPQPMVAEAKMKTLSERDIPITRPENYHYSPEEIALMKKQANEAYLKWAQLELEISKHNLEQTAQK